MSQDKEREALDRRDRECEEARVRFEKAAAKLVADTTDEDAYKEAREALDKLRELLGMEPLDWMEMEAEG